MSNKSSQLLIVLIIALQFTFIIGRVATKEHTIKSAQEIIVKLAPLDPRSLLQGDYVLLRYEITNLTEAAPKVPSGFLPKRIKVVLTQKNNVYTYKTHLAWTQDYTLEPGDIIMNGKIKGGNSVVFGIENYFIEEGTGREVERNSKYAKLKIASNGDAYITELLEKLPLP